MLYQLLTAAGLTALVVAAGYGALFYMTSVPGQSYEGELPPLTAEERTLGRRLKHHVDVIAAREHNLVHWEELENVARYIEATLASYGYVVHRQVFRVHGKTVRNMDVSIEPTGAVAAPEVIVVGAHYDSAEGTPGANDNATGVAAVLELARLLRDLDGHCNKRIRFAFFVNEEPPYFKTPAMGSLHYARALAERKERVIAMYSLETMGFYSSAPGSQKYPPLFGLMLPHRGNFIAFVGMLAARPLVRETIGSFRSHTAFPSVGGVAPAFVPGIDWSDHWSFARYGFPALMITDTAPYRYPHYHRSSDTPDKVDADMLARVVKGIERVIRDLAQRGRSSRLSGGAAVKVKTNLFWRRLMAQEHALVAAIEWPRDRGAFFAPTRVQPFRAQPALAPGARNRRVAMTQWRRPSASQFSRIHLRDEFCVEIGLDRIRAPLGAVA